MQRPLQLSMTSLEGRLSSKEGKGRRRAASVIIILWLMICGFLAIVRLKVFQFWLDLLDALFLYFGWVSGCRFLTQKHVLPLGCNFLNDFLR